MAESRKDNKSRQDIIIELINGLLSSRWVSFIDLNLAVNEESGSLPGIDFVNKTKEEYYTELMIEGGYYRNNINQAFNRMTDAWALVRRGVDIEGVLEKEREDYGNDKSANKKKPSNPIRDEFKRLFIDIKKIRPTDSDEKLSKYSLSEATLWYLRNNPKIRALSIYTYLEKGYSILEDLKYYDKERESMRILRLHAPSQYYDFKEANKYGIIPAPEVISRKRKLLTIQVLQDELLRETSDAVKRSIDEIERIKRNKPFGWQQHASEKYLNAIYDSQGILDKLERGHILHLYGSHLLDQKNYSQGDSFLEESLEVIREEKMSGNNNGKEEYALILQNRACQHVIIGNYTLAEEEVLEGLDIFQELAKCDDKYSYGVALLLSTLADLHVNMKKYDTVEDEYYEAIVLFSKLSDEEPAKYLYMLIRCKTSLATFYYLVKKLDESAEFFMQSISTLDMLMEKNYDDFAPQKVEAMINYSNTLQDKGLFENAEDILYESIRIIEVLNERSPNVYNEELSTAYQCLGALYGNTGEIVRAREMLLKAEGYRRVLAAVNPYAYNKKLAITLDSLANLDLLSEKDNEAICKWEEALSLFQVYDNAGNCSFSSEKGKCFFYIGLIFLNRGEKDKSLSFLSKAESLFKTVFTKASIHQNFENIYALTLSYLGVLYESIEGKKDESERKYEESLDIALWYNCVANTLDHSFLILVYCNYASFLFNEGRYEDAKQMLEQAFLVDDTDEKSKIFSPQAKTLLSLLKKNILESKSDDEYPNYAEIDKMSEGINKISFPPEGAIKAVNNTANEIEGLNKKDVAYQIKCRFLYRDSLQYVRFVPESIFLADYLSSLCAFFADSFIFKPILDNAPIALRIYEKALQEDNSNFELRLKYIELLSRYCHSLNEYNHHDETFKTIESAFEFLKPLGIKHRDDVACTYAALKVELLCDYIFDDSTEEAYSTSIVALNYYRDVSRPRKDYLCRIISKAAFIACKNEKFQEAEVLISEAEELMKDCDLSDSNLRLCLGHLFIVKGIFIDITPQKWPDNYSKYSITKTLEAFSFARKVLEGGVIYNPAPFKCALLDLYRIELISMGVYSVEDIADKPNKSDFYQRYMEADDSGCGKLILVTFTKDVLRICKEMLALIPELIGLNEYVFSWRSAIAYLQLIEATQEVSFLLYFKKQITIDEFKDYYEGVMSMYSDVESLLNIYRSTATSRYSEYMSWITNCKIRFNKNYRNALAEDIDVDDC